MQDPIVLLYVAAVLARHLDGTNHALIELKRITPVSHAT
jgi:hypothetical protein